MTYYRGNYDSLGFTQETEALLTGLNCTNLKGFKKRRINLDDLRKLTDEDLATLGKYLLLCYVIYVYNYYRSYRGRR